MSVCACVCVRERERERERKRARQTDRETEGEREREREEDHTDDASLALKHRLQGSLKAISERGIDLSDLHIPVFVRLVLTASLIVFCPPMKRGFTKTKIKINKKGRLRSRTLVIECGPMAGRW